MASQAHAQTTRSSSLPQPLVSIAQLRTYRSRSSRLCPAPTVNHVFLVGSVHYDSIYNVRTFPDEGSKVEACSVDTRGGGTCYTITRMLQTLMSEQATGALLHLITSLPERWASATQQLLAPFQDDERVDLSHCFYRDGYTDPPRSCIIRSNDTRRHTIVSYSDLPQLTYDEFKGVVHRFGAVTNTWWHFNGRLPDTLACMHYLRRKKPSAAISIVLDKPAILNLPRLALEADVVFYTRSWALSRGHADPITCLSHESRNQRSKAFCYWGTEGGSVWSPDIGFSFRGPDMFLTAADPVDAIGVDGIFIAGVLFGLCFTPLPWTPMVCLDFGLCVARLKTQRHGIDGIAAEAYHWLWSYLGSGTTIFPP